MYGMLQAGITFLLSSEYVILYTNLSLHNSLDLDYTLFPTKDRVAGGKFVASRAIVPS